MEIWGNFEISEKNLKILMIFHEIWVILKKNFKNLQNFENQKNNTDWHSPQSLEIWWAKKCPRASLPESKYFQISKTQMFGPSFTRR